VLGRRRPPPEGLLQLGDQPGLGLGMAGQQVEGIGQGQRRRLEPGQEQRDHLVPQLPVGQPAARLPLGLQQP